VWEQLSKKCSTTINFFWESNKKKRRYDDGGNLILNFSLMKKIVTNFLSLSPPISAIVAFFLLSIRGIQLFR
jgi:hypothetical protein